MEQQTYAIWIGNGYLDSTRNTPRGLRDVAICKKIIGNCCYVRYMGGQLEQVLDDGVLLSYLPDMHSADNAVIALREAGIMGALSIRIESIDGEMEEVKIIPAEAEPAMTEERTMTKHYEYADTATINKPKLYERTEKSPLTSYANKFPKTARNYQGYILIGQGREFIKITHAVTPSREWGYIAQVDLKIMIEFFGILFGATSHGTIYHAYEKAGGCGYDKHNATLFNMMRHIGIEPYGEQGGHGGIYGHGEAGSKQALQSIGNYLYEQYGLETSVIEI